MNRKSLILTLLISLFLVNVSSVFAAVDTKPVPKLPQSYRDKYRTNLFTGSAGYQYPIKVPKGTNDLTPDVSLSYDSAGTKDVASYVGQGWQLNI